MYKYFALGFGNPTKCCQTPTQNICTSPNGFCCAPGTAPSAVQPGIAFDVDATPTTCPSPSPSVTSDWCTFQCCSGAATSTCTHHPFPPGSQDTVHCHCT